MKTEDVQEIKYETHSFFSLFLSSESKHQSKTAADDFDVFHSIVSEQICLDV